MRVPVQNLVKQSARPLAVMAIALASATCVLPAMMPANAAPTPPSTLTSTQQSTIQSQVQGAISGLPATLTGAARIQAISAALVQITQTDTASMGAAAIDAIVSDAMQAGVAPTTVVDAVIRGAVAGGVPGSTAIADVVLAAIHNGAPAANVAAQALATGTAIPLPPDVTGTGLGMAAAALSRTGDIADATAIGQTVANEGIQPLRTAYRDGVLANGGSVELAALGNSFPLATGETGEGREIGNGQNDNHGNRNQGNDNGNQGNGNNQQANTNQNQPPCSGPSCS